MQFLKLKNPRKVTYILSNIDKAVAFEWIFENIPKGKIHVDFILVSRTPQCHLYEYLGSRGAKPKFLQYPQGKIGLLKVFLFIIVHLLKNRPHVVHTHLFEASIAGLTAAKLLFIGKRIYTRHHSTFHHDYFPSAVKIDKFINWLSTDIVAISQNVEDILEEREDVPKSKLNLIHHGFDLKKFSSVSPSDTAKMKEKYLNGSPQPVIGVISRYIEWKGIHFIVPAFKKILERYPSAHFIFANASGPDKDKVKASLRELPPESYTEISFEPNLYGLYSILDLYVHTPIDPDIEAFGQTYVEALAAGVPTICTLSGVGKEFIKDGSNALVVDYKSSDDIYRKTCLLLEDEELKSKLKKNGLESVEPFALDHFIKKLTELYSKQG